MQHTTSYTYDKLGRRKSRTLPMGQMETYTYDAVGNLKTKIDFNGHTTTYGYDPNNNWLTSKTADSFFSTGSCAGGACGATSIGFTYTATGKRKTMIDATGTTTYTYDPNTDRLLTKQTPFGTLTYAYDNAGNVQSIASSNANGASMAYTYDADNRLKTVSDASGLTNYGYDDAGNLQSFAYPNGVVHGYTYDALNRLTNLAVCTGAASPCNATTANRLNNYAYTLGPAGNRKSVTELNGGTVTYGYDDLYRLTSETIASDPGGNNGAVGYTYDNVGNRQQITSTLGAIPAGQMFYDNNDRLTTDQYDNNGNTIVNASTTNVYDFENHLVQHGAVTIAYDADGNRVAETTGAGTTQYLMDTLNPTGYAQVVDELQSGSVTKSYSYGLERISQNWQLSPGNWQLSFYGYDGHGSVRFLTDSAGAITDAYDYDAFGNLLASTGSTSNNYRFAGEQFDAALGIYYNRARYYDERNGRFWATDTLQGSDFEPKSLHRYVYASNNPVNRIDPSGLEDADLATNELTLADYAILTTAAVISLTLACVAVAGMSNGGGPCGNGSSDDRKRQFYRGTTYYEGLAILDNPPDLTRFLTAPESQKYDFGPGFYMTESRTVAVYFAEFNAGPPGNRVKGGPAILDITIKESNWNFLLREGAKEGPLTGLPGSSDATQAFVPIQVIPQFLKFARIIMFPLE